MLNFPDRLFPFTVRLQELAKEFGYEIKTDAYEVAFWPAYDKETGGLGEWLAMYIRERKVSSGISKTPGKTEGTEVSN